MREDGRRKLEIKGDTQVEIRRGGRRSEMSEENRRKEIKGDTEKERRDGR